MGTENPDDLISAARRQFRSAELLCDELAVVLLPRSGATPSERLQSATKVVLFTLVSAVERRLLGRADTTMAQSVTWRQLVESGLLADAGLMGFAYARAIEEELADAIKSIGGGITSPRIPVQLLSHLDPQISDLAHDLLRASGAAYCTDNGRIEQLPADILHLLAGRVAATLIDSEFAEASRVEPNLRTLLETHDEARRVASIAGKLAFFLPEEKNLELRDPVVSGIPLFLAWVEKQTGIEYDRLLQLIAHPKTDAFALVLRCCDLTKRQALAILAALRPATDLASDSAVVEAIFDALSSKKARSGISAWSNDGIAA